MAQPPIAVAQYHRPPRRVHFPEEAIVPETRRHLDLRTLLYILVRGAFAPESSVGSDQFVYWDASNPSLCLAPDLLVRRGVPDSAFGSWKTWERGAPDLAVEIVSDSDSSETAWQSKLARYHAAGVTEVVRFDADAPLGSRIRVWDRVEGDLVERVVSSDVTPCRVLGGAFVVTREAGIGNALRISRDAEGKDLWPTPEEARLAANTRIRELEEALRRRGG